MTDDFQGVDDKLQNWLDDDAVNDFTAADAPMATAESRKVAESLVVHGLLHDLARQDQRIKEQRIAAVMKSIASRKQKQRSPVSLASLLYTRGAALAAGVTALAACVVLIVMLEGPNTATAAMASLERVIVAASKRVDRTYVIQVVEDDRPRQRPRDLRRQHRRGPAEEVDGALLHVRGTDRFVFIRKLADGQQRISGCDGEHSWAFSENGPVHVSSDPTRFRGGLPGQQQDLPLINMRTHLEQLRDRYNIELLPNTSQSTDERTLSGLFGVRKSRSVRGPKRIEIWFDAETGTIQSMLLEGLPRAKGGPRSVCVTLIDQQELAPDFFTHEFHHEDDRAVLTKE